MDYETLKVLAKKMKRPVTSLIALAAQNDPFYVGTDADLRYGEWFVDLWNKFGYTTGVHIRRMHYAIVSQDPPVIRPNGMPYENTQACWEFLVNASTRARYLGLVDPAAFVDRRNGLPMDHADYVTRLAANAYVPPADLFDENLSLPEFPSLPEYYLVDFNSPQRYHLEIWCEKSTMNDILDRVASRYQAVVQYGMGELSITIVLEAINRFKRSGKPVRIFYASDFDPAGATMPVSISRKLEYFIRKEELNIDVKLFPVVLTYEQVQGYALPTTPLKAGERRAPEFMQRYGVDGAVELDALEALHQGQLERILRKEIERYYDDTLSSRLFSARSRAWSQLHDAMREVHAEFEEEIDALQAEHQAIEALVQERMSRYLQRKSDLWHAISERLDDNMPEISEDNVPDAIVASERDDALYDSFRGYLEQNGVYQEYKGKDLHEEASA